MAGSTGSVAAPLREHFLAALAGDRFATPFELTVACVDELPVQRAAIIVRTGAGPVLAAASDVASGAVEQAQLTLGLGPALDVLARSEPVLVPDLTRARWPLLTAAVELGGALFALPLQLGAIRVGVLDLYRSAPGPLDARELGVSLDAADLVTTTLLLSSAGHLASGSPEEDGGTWPVGRGGVDDREVHQATGMVSVQLGCSVGDAYVLLRARAFADGTALTDLARDVVARRVRLGPDGDGGSGGRSPDVGPA